MNNKQTFCYIILCVQSLSLFCGLAKIHNQTNAPATVRFKTLTLDSTGTSWTQNENETVISVPAKSGASEGYAEGNIPNAALNKFKFQSSIPFAIGGFWGERFKPAGDGTYPEIVVPATGTWDIYIVNK